jgi:hypothetical protein
MSEEEFRTAARRQLTELRERLELTENCNAALVTANDSLQKHIELLEGDNDKLRGLIQTVLDNWNYLEADLYRELAEAVGQEDE